MRFRNSPGFTLVELIVALTVMAMVMTVAFAGFRTGLNAWERGTKAAERMDRRGVVERLIRRQLPLAVPKDVFRGANDRLEFIADYSLVDGSGDFRKIDYAAQKGRFLYGEKMLFGYVPQEHEEQPSTVLADLRSVSFEFLGEDDFGKPAWLPEWDRGSQIPSAVRVSLDDDTFVVRMVNRQ